MTSILKHAVFQHELAKTTAHFGRSSGIRVVFEGDKPRTNGKTVVLPQLDGGQDIDEEFLRAMRGYVDHEAGGHCIHTDFRKMAEANALDKTGKLAHILNGLEDPRIDQLHCQTYPGAAKNIRTTAAMVARKNLEEITDEQMADIHQIAAVAATWLGRKKIGLGSPEIDAAIARLPAEVRQRIEPFVDRALAAKDTGSVLKLAKQLWKEIDEPPQDGDGQGDGQGGGGQGSGQGNGQGNGQGGQGQQDGQAQDQGQPQMLDPGLGQMFDGLDGDGAGDAEKDKNGKCLSDPFNFAAGTEFNTEAKVVSADEAPNWARASKDASPYEMRKAQLNSTIGVMVKTFERILASRTMRDRHRGLESGRLDGRRLTQAAIGNPNVFWRQAARSEVNTFVEVLVDVSSSMSSRSNMLATSLVAISEALERAGVAWSAHTFCGAATKSTELARVKMFEAVKKADEELAQQGINKVVSWHDVSCTAHTLLMVQLKAPSERLVRVKGRIGAMPKLITGGTPLGPAIVRLWPDVAKREEPKKVVLVLTDGEPDHFPYTKAVIDEAEQAGVVMIGIGIQTDVVDKLFRRHAVVREATDLVGATLRQLQQAIDPLREAA